MRPKAIVTFLTKPTMFIIIHNLANYNSFSSSARLF